MDIPIISKVVQTGKKKPQQAGAEYCRPWLRNNFEAWLLSVQLFEEKNWTKCHRASRWVIFLFCFHPCAFPLSSDVGAISPKTLRAKKGPESRCCSICLWCRSWRTWVEFLPWCCWNSLSSAVSSRANPSLQFRTVPEAWSLLQNVFHGRKCIYR